MSPPRDKTDMGNQGNSAEKENQQGSGKVMELKEVRGYVLENFKAGVWKTSVAAVLVFENYETAEFFRNQGINESEDWVVVPVKITRQDPDR
jgi:hypothetical protein